MNWDKKIKHLKRKCTSNLFTLKQMYGPNKCNKADNLYLYLQVTKPIHSLTDSLKAHVFGLKTTPVNDH